MSGRQSAAVDLRGAAVMTWISVDSTPPLLDVEWWEGKRRSEPVLGVLSNGRRQVVVLEAWDDAPLRWFTDCSEHWLVEDLVAWQPLPPPPCGPVSKA